MEQSVLRKVKFFQDKKQNGFNNNGDSRSSSKGFSLGKLGRWFCIKIYILFWLIEICLVPLIVWLNSDWLNNK